MTRRAMMAISVGGLIAGTVDITQAFIVFGAVFLAEPAVYRPLH